MKTETYTGNGTLRCRECRHESKFYDADMRGPENCPACRSPRLSFKWEEGKPKEGKVLKVFSEIFEEVDVSTRPNTFPQSDQRHEWLEDPLVPLADDEIPGPDGPIKVDGITEIFAPNEVLEEIRRVSELEFATSHQGDPCGHCDLTFEQIKVGPCSGAQCDVLGCVQPKDPNYVTESIVGKPWSYCSTHGKVYSDYDVAFKKVNELLVSAELEGRVVGGVPTEVIDREIRVRELRGQRNDARRKYHAAAQVARRAHEEIKKLRIELSWAQGLCPDCGEGHQRHLVCLTEEDL